MCRPREGPSAATWWTACSPVTVYGLRRAYCSATFRARWLSARASGSGRCSHPQPEEPVVNGELLPEKIPEKIVAGSGPILKLVVGDSSPEKLVVVGNSPETLGPRLRRQSTSCGREEHLSTQLQLAGALARPGKLAAAAAYSLRLEAGSAASALPDTREGDAGRLGCACFFVKTIAIVVYNVPADGETAPLSPCYMWPMRNPIARSFIIAAARLGSGR
ncbi:hypothetical protein PF008_g26726 [Phytophthora fragariae]|uniref:Uncharacterized protein n=1 Tax=Phytophthora fragariae TaxID=53985 RepID=A0A6G0QG93_9STRA|nr:hypothetical protein PF008_g26726 [Phytophthora fragariae]